MILLDWSKKPKTGVAKVPPKRKIPLESMQLTLKERDSTASFVTNDLTDIEISSWIMDDSEPGKDICWRVKSIEQVYGTGSHKVTLEHAINLLRDRIIWGEYKASDIINTVTNSSGSTASTCTAKQALQFIFGGQEDWLLDMNSFEYTNVYGAYSFDGDTLYDALETVCGTLEDCEWLMDMSKYPFTFRIRRKLDGAASELRAGRNLRTITKTIDRSGMYTRLFPVGYDDLQLSTERSKAAVEDVRHPDRIKTYGVIEKSETNTSLDSKQTLNDWALNKLHLNNAPSVTISVEALELSDATGEPMDHFILNRICRIPLPEFGGQTVSERIIELNFPDKIGKPEECKLTLSNSKTELTTILASISKTTSSSTRTSARTSKSLNETKNIVLDTVKDVRIKGSDKNKYTLQYLLVRGDKDKESDWKNGGNFSRAVDSWQVSVAGGAIRVKALPQDQDHVVYVQGGTISRSGNLYSGQIQWRHSTDGGKTYTDWASTGKTFTVDATERYNQGKKDAIVAGSWSGGAFTAYNTSNTSHKVVTAIFDTIAADVTWTASSGKESVKVYANMNGGETRIDTGKTLTFNTKVKPIVSGSWSNGTLTVTTNPAGSSSTTFGLFDAVAADVTWNAANSQESVKVYANLNGGETKIDTGKTLTFTTKVKPIVSGSWDNGTLTVTTNPAGSSATTFGIFDTVAADVTWNASNSKESVKVYANLNGGETKIDTGKTLTFTTKVKPIVSSSWNSGILTITTNPAGSSSTTFGLFDARNSDVTWSGNTASIKIYADKNDDETRHNTGKTLTITGAHNVAQFSTSSPSGAQVTINGTTYTNNSDGYYINGSGRIATVIIATKGNWKCNTVDQEEMSYLSTTPSAIYTKGYDNAPRTVSDSSVGTFSSSVDPNNALNGWSPQQLTGVGNSQQGYYRYIKFKVDGKQRSFYFA